MPSPIVHLNVISQVSKCLTLSLTPDLLLGSISPDAIHMRPNQTWADKSVTHFYDIADDDFFDAISQAKQMLTEVAPDFKLGYLIHLYTDYLWREVIYAPYFHARKETMARLELHALYYRDMQRIDEVLKSSVLMLVPELKQAMARHGCPFLSQGEIEQWCHKVLEQDLGKGERMNGELEVFSMTDIQLFIETCTQQIVTYFHVFEG
ncbi:hypothetical protein GMB50_08970 [Turicibacter sanguinis]|uniref:zinc dependent phospholipase C family protein n=1 Tax=Turicibacter sanguinis TaxID=154288 RepID=UPI0012BBFAA0|nr:zinc dependent phospholipase C family protein [Turicibacter sanguinis]MCU7197868.1 hypothetical protein [Turicibacter sanguinis]MDB8566232.1 hypothetical protein [Turicibacter sanguinis]MDB8568904.1 hypothetical protein [Turicibacter sanguinis]MDB8571733.1 hypothetical protein [Turicibacter sanguinis]MDB8580413.1 hypothetical protein [Turicibacter sanguinis]